VKASQRHHYILLILALFAFFFLIPIAQSADAHNIAQSEPIYHIEKQWVKIWINKDDGTIDLFYNLTLVCDSGTISWIKIGQPNKDFTIGISTNEYGQNLTATKLITEDSIGVQIFLKTPIFAGEKATVILLTRVDKMLWEDEQNLGNVGMLFIPTWWPYQVEDLRIAVVLPGNVSETEIRYPLPYPKNTYLEEGNRVVYWNKTSLAPNEQFQIGVSFPKQYVTFWYSKSTWDKIGEAIGPFLGPAIALSVMAIVVVVAVKSVKKFPYTEPKLSMEVLGVRKGLTAVEAAILLDVDPRKLLTMILFGLLHKNAVEVVETEPYLRLKILSTSNLHYYEIGFINAAIKPSPMSANDTLAGTLDDKKLSDVINDLHAEVDEKVKYYCRADTIAYYRKVIGKAWAQVSAAKTPEIKAVQFNENLEWLAIHPEFKRRTKRLFRGEEEIPSTSAWWLPYWFAYHASPSFRGTGGQQATPPTALPAVQFADAVVTSIESTTNRMVRDIETFTRSILPPAASSSGEGRSPPNPVHSGGCVCACASCACACACVSCACACASGGAG